MTALKERKACLTNEVLELLKQNTYPLEAERESKAEVDNSRKKLK